MFEVRFKRTLVLEASVLVEDRNQQQVQNELVPMFIQKYLGTIKWETLNSLLEWRFRKVKDTLEAIEEV